MLAPAASSGEQGADAVTPSWIPRWLHRPSQHQWSHPATPTIEQPPGESLQSQCSTTPLPPLPSRTISPPRPQPPPPLRLSVSSPTSCDVAASDASAKAAPARAAEFFARASGSLRAAQVNPDPLETHSIAAQRPERRLFASELHGHCEASMHHSPYFCSQSPCHT